MEQPEGVKDKELRIRINQNRGRIRLNITKFLIEPLQYEIVFQKLWKKSLHEPFRKTLDESTPDYTDAVGTQLTLGEAGGRSNGGVWSQLLRLYSFCVLSLGK